MCAWYKAAARRSSIQRGMGIRTRLVALDPTNSSWQYDLAITLFKLDNAISTRQTQSRGAAAAQG